jgi:hypothetical protein
MSIVKSTEEKLKFKIMNTSPKLSVLWLRMNWMELDIFNEHSRLFTAQQLSI